MGTEEIDGASGCDCSSAGECVAAEGFAGAAVSVDGAVFVVFAAFFDLEVLERTFSFGCFATGSSCFSVATSGVDIGSAAAASLGAVSYTHLDVYKRQE